MIVTFDATYATALIRFPYPPPPEKDEVKRLGARFDGDLKTWRLPANANTVRWLAAHHVDIPAAVQSRVDAAAAAKAATLAASRAADANIDVPHPESLDYLPFQRAGIKWALDRPASLIGDEMGLGKTIQALGVINTDPTIRRVLIVAPLSVAINWQREAQKWLTRPLSVEIATAKTWPAADLTVVHWGIVSKHAQTIRAQAWDLVVLDEAHYAKNPKAARTKALFGDARAGLPPLNARRKLALTGTPIPNRPIEIHPVLRWLAPAEFGNWKHFAVRYADAYQSRFGWDTSGAAHLDELQERLRTTVMIRRQKKDVQKELPAKTRQAVILAADTPALKKALKAEQRVVADTADAVARAKVAVELAKAESTVAYAEAVAALRRVGSIAFQEMSRVRHDTAVAKIPNVLDHLQDLLAEEGRKIVLFTHHRDALDQIGTALEAGDKEHPAVQTVRVMGGISPERRQAAVDAFQEDPAVRVFLGTIGAAKEGITLTASSHVVFSELDWVPGNLSQAEDRVHRIGQKDAVTIQHMLLDGSIDQKMVETMLQKQVVLGAALDVQVRAGASAEALDYGSAPDEGDLGVEAITVAAGDAAATHSTSRDTIATRAERITPDQIAAVHAGLRMLAGLDADYARTRNDAGFSKIDVAIGHDLAGRDTLTPKQAALGAKLLAKYHRQLPDEIAGIWAALGEAANIAQPTPPAPAKAHRIEFVEMGRPPRSTPPQPTAQQENDGPDLSL